MTMRKHARFEVLVVAIIAAFCTSLKAGEAPSGKSIVGIIPGGSIQVGEGCTHYLAPIKSPNDYQNRILFYWGLMSSDEPKMNIGGKTVDVHPLTPYPEILLRKLKKGARFSERYQFGSTTMRFDNKITFVCPPDSEGGCEVTRFDGVLTVEDGERREVYQTSGECGH